MRVRFKRAWRVLLVATGAGAIAWLGIISFGCIKSTRTAFDKIEMGMTGEEVDDILGYGPNMVDGGSTNIDVRWSSPTGEKIIVTFGRESGVHSKKFVESNLTLHRKLWVHLQELFSSEFKQRDGFESGWYQRWWHGPRRKFKESID